MAKAVIAYDKVLPEISDRQPWEKPTSFLVKDDAAQTGWREDTSGRRPSRLLLVPKIRAAVDSWREQGYPGASDVTRRLFEYWFDKDHEVADFPVPFRYYFCQREAIETLVWLVEIAEERDAQKLIQARATKFTKDLFSDNILFQTTMDGQRQLRRYVPELDHEGVQDLPPEDLRRFAFKMATGSGKTWVIVQKVKAGEVNWIIETKGRVWEGTAAKDEAIRDWCARITEATKTAWCFVRVDQVDFEARQPTTVAELAGNLLQGTAP